MGFFRRATPGGYSEVGLQEGLPGFVVGRVAEEVHSEAISARVAMAAEKAPSTRAARLRKTR